MRYFWLLLLFFIAAYIVPLGVRTSVVPDEFRYAQIPREMIESGDYVTPRLLGMRYFEKPVMGYWLTAGSFKIFGFNRFANRLPAALATGLTALIIAWTIVQTGGGNKLAALAAAVYLSCGLVYGIGTFAVLDAQVTLFITMANFAMLLALLEPRFTRRKAVMLLVAGVGAGLAFLTKGFIAFAVPGLSVAGYLVLNRRFREFLILPWVPLAAIAAVVLPWAWAIHRADPDYWRYFVVVEHFQRFTSGGEGQHPEPWWFLIPPLIGGAFPAALLAVPGAAIGRRWRELFSQPLYRYMLCALVLPFLFFSLSSGKLATYVLPCFAPLAVLLAGAVATYFRSGGHNLVFKYTMDVFGWLLVASGVVGLTGAALLGSFDWFAEFPSRPEVPLLLAVTGGAALIAGGTVLWVRNRSWGLRLQLFFAAIAVVMLAGSVTLPGFDNDKMPEKILRELPAGAGFDPDKATIVTVSGLVHAIAWTYGRTDIFAVSPGELEYGYRREQADNGREFVISYGRLRELFRNPPPGGVVYIHRSPDRDPLNQGSGKVGRRRVVRHGLVVDLPLSLESSAGHE